MHGNWAEVRGQLEQGLECERRQRQVHRQRQQTYRQSFQSWWLPALTALATIRLGARASTMHPHSLNSE